MEDSKFVEVNLIKIVKICWHGKLTYFVILILGVLGSVFYAFKAKSIYETKMSILPPAQDAGGNGLMSALGGLSALTGQSVVGRDQNQLYTTLLKSPRLYGDLVERMNLNGIFENKSEKEIVGLINSGVKVELDKETGLLELYYRDTDTLRMYKIINGMVDQLGLLVESINNKESVSKRVFVEQQLKDVQSNLSNAEVELKSMQKKTGIVELESQNKATLEALSALQSDLGKKNSELSALSKIASEQNPNVIKLKSEIQSIVNQIEQLKSGNNNIMISKSEAPDLNLEYIRKSRNVKYYETMFEILAKQFEMAKMEESKSGPNFIVIEKAEKYGIVKVKPKKGLIIVIGFVMSNLLGAIGALLFGFFKLRKRK